MNLLRNMFERIVQLDFDPSRQMLVESGTLCLASLLLLVVLLATGAALLVNAALLVPLSTTVAVAITIALMRRLKDRCVTEPGSLEELNHVVWRGRQPSLRDPRTTLMQRWYFELRLAEEAERCRRQDLEMVVLFIPAKTEGAQSAASGSGEGDEIRQTSVGGLRLTDLAAKIDPREYAVCLTHTSESQARVAARRLLGELGAKAQICRLAVCPGDGMNLQELLGNARPFQGIESTYAPRDSKPRRRNDALVSLLSTSQSGIVPVEDGQTFAQAKARVRRASRRALVKVKVWEDDGLLYFERIERVSPAEVAEVA